MVGRASQRRLGAALSFVLVVAAASNAAAWGVDSAFSEPCHERLSGEAFLRYTIDTPLDWLPVPEGRTWRKIARYTFDFMPQDVGDLTDAQRFLLMSLLVGARAPDTEGHSIFSLQTMRQFHADPDPKGQYAHALRADDDDGVAGNRRAVDGTREAIRKLVERAEEIGRRDAEDQIIEVPFYTEFYGRVKIEVWGPGYYYGRATHALQDTFAHTVRDEADGYRSIVHVMNYIDAIAGDLDDERDGLAHSDYRDRCTGDHNAEMVEAGTEATIDFLYALRSRAMGWDPGALDHFMDYWLTLRDGCTLDNDLCGNVEQLRLTRKSPTGPYLEGMLGCQAAAPEPLAFPLGFFVLALVAAGLYHGSRRRGV